jgi:hypothetical protein
MKDYEAFLACFWQNGQKHIKLFQCLSLFCTAFAFYKEQQCRPCIPCRLKASLSDKIPTNLVNVFQFPLQLPIFATNSPFGIPYHLREIYQICDVIQCIKTPYVVINAEILYLDIKPSGYSTGSAGCLSHRSVHRAASPSGTPTKRNMFALNVVSEKLKCKCIKISQSRVHFYRSFVQTCVYYFIELRTKPDGGIIFIL